MIKMYFIIGCILGLIIFRDIAYSEKYTNPIGGDWITLDSSRVYKKGEGDSGRAMYIDIARYDSLNWVAMANDGFHGFSYNVVKKTTDGGETWSVVLLDSGWYKFPSRVRIFYPAKDIIVIGCDSGYVVRSTDGGATWDEKERMEIPAENGRLWRMYMKGKIAIMQYEALRKDYISYDYGDTWSKVDNFEVHFLYEFADYYSIIDSTTIFASGLVEEQLNPTDKRLWTYYFTTTDKGNTWKQVRKVPRDETYWWRPLYINKDVGYSSDLLRREGKGYDPDTTTSTIYKTYNGGKDWIKIYESTDLGIGFIFINCYDENHIMASSYSACIYSSNGGISWEKIEEPKFEDLYEYWALYSPVMISPTSWIIGDGPKILKYVGKDKSIPELSIEGDVLTVSPNPATDFISLTGFAPGERIEIYSQLGVKILEATLEVEKIDISMLPAGVYFMKIEGKVGKFVKAN